MKVLFVAGDPKPERWTVPIKELLPEAEVHVWDANGPAVDADYAIVWQPPEQLFEREKKLKAVFNLGAGIDGLLAVPNLPPQLPIVRLEDAGMSAQMAEYVLHQLLEASRGMETYREQQRQGIWKIHRPIKRSEWPVGVMGLGHIGKRVARTLAGLDYRVNGWARSKHDLDGVSTFSGTENLTDFLQSTRVLVNTLPLTDETRDILNHKHLSQLMPNAVVINVGRGEHLVEEDLIKAIEDGHVARASLDVFRQEPLPADHPFWQRPEITITPHISARTLREATLEQITGKIQAHHNGQPISGIVDPSRGY
ncbi:MULTISPECIES: 2-hydroxyacid dehydrogenase [Marinobacter]|jgi:glyoxylate/hydroxypyruvate reductase A|uniref:2-hydroxyacid dehydrogenase n=1 Tax=Marinobacter TaxID=2742 RepID=UPI000C92D688|nr:MULTISPECIES: glyoxylate/hydroxypyruvate reductase A [unclassified Marinobacter]MAB51550.1 glyoxylate/hydroxypyruvate reductase A [Marinobacter sp.]RUT77311.1 glyoxylate/hydroxypyruvate reductase A [Marinobacter sp. NP-6]|tara:strand:+ start:581 stop:1510 length:930 start_codon:yes stop_codon:yes gene_type:complete